jgi:hypothetical protein
MQKERNKKVLLSINHRNGVKGGGGIVFTSKKIVFPRIPSDYKFLKDITFEHWLPASKPQ